MFVDGSAACHGLIYILGFTLLCFSRLIRCDMLQHRLCSAVVVTLGAFDMWPLFSDEDQNIVVNKKLKNVLLF